MTLGQGQIKFDYAVMSYPIKYAKNSKNMCIALIECTDCLPLVILSKSA